MWKQLFLGRLQVAVRSGMQPDATHDQHAWDAHLGVRGVCRAVVGDEPYVLTGMTGRKSSPCTWHSGPCAGARLSWAVADKQPACSAGCWGASSTAVLQRLLHAPWVAVPQGNEHPRSPPTSLTAPSAALQSILQAAHPEGIRSQGLSWRCDGGCVSALLSCIAPSMAETSSLDVSWLLQLKLQTADGEPEGPVAGASRSRLSPDRASSPRAAAGVVGVVGCAAEWSTVMLANRWLRCVSPARDVTSMVPCDRSAWQVITWAGSSHVKIAPQALLKHCCDTHLRMTVCRLNHAV